MRVERARIGLVRVERAPGTAGVGERGGQCTVLCRHRPVVAQKGHLTPFNLPARAFVLGYYGVAVCVCVCVCAWVLLKAGA